MTIPRLLKAPYLTAAAVKGHSGGTGYASVTLTTEQAVARVALAIASVEASPLPDLRPGEWANLTRRERELELVVGVEQYQSHLDLATELGVELASYRIRQRLILRAKRRGGP